MKKTSRALLYSLLALLVFGTSCANSETRTERQNVLFIAIDDLKPLAGAYGNSRVVTPSIDALAKNGTVFTHAYVQYKRKGAYGYSMRTEQYRYTEWVTADGTVVYRDLYDLHNDPGERINIGDLEANSELMASLATLLRKNGEGLLRIQ
jgi:arylsulfatase A-like enzyme